MLLDEIQNAAVDPNSDLGTLLRKCKVLAAQLGSAPVEQWILLEANGYPADGSVPKYRMLPMTLKGRFQSATHSGNGLVIPHACLPENVRDDLINYKARESISALQNLTTKGDDGGTIVVPYSDLPILVQGRAYPTMNCYEAWGEVSFTSMLEVVNTVRNRILDFVLALRKELPDMGKNSDEEDVASIPQDRVTQIFMTMNGGNANVVGNAVHSPVSMNVTVNDLASLRNVLTENGISGSDISDLETALQEEPKPESGKFGPKVAAWIGRMMGKAADGTWQIGIGAAGALLVEAIKGYYGFTSQ